MSRGVEEQQPEMGNKYQLGSSSTKCTGNKLFELGGNYVPSLGFTFLTYKNRELSYMDPR